MWREEGKKVYPHQSITVQVEIVIHVLIYSYLAETTMMFPQLITYIETIYFSFQEILSTAIKKSIFTVFSEELDIY